MKAETLQRISAFSIHESCQVQEQSVDNGKQGFRSFWIAGRAYPAHGNATWLKSNDVAIVVDRALFRTSDA